ncbi:MAG: PIN domain-containing protein [Candidatus Bipolaricaulota bacterium]|nr:PIN domain-containing protein [Candidatus Bipolaricaulota bacterium]MDW8031855.1 PIN domain-containing protein [Candidatus Bipolaricaulota bacterium]
MDTNVLIAGLLFASGMGREILELAEGGEFVLLLPEVVRREVEAVIARDFPDHLASLGRWLQGAWRVTPMPSVHQVRQALRYVTDPKDAPLLASVLQAQPDYFVTNDIAHFHTALIKRLLRERGIELRTPYGFLKALGRR